MARGYPDGGSTDYGRAAQIADLGEVANRLLLGGGGISRTGRVVWASGFEGGQLSDFQLGGNVQVVTGASVQALGFSAWQGNYLLLLQVNTTPGNTAQFFKYFPATIQSGKWGLEAMIDFECFNSSVDLIMSKSGTAGVNGLKGDIQIQTGATNNFVKLFYKNTGGTFVQFADLGGVFALGTGAYYNVKWVPDLAANNYGRFVINNTVYDLSAFAMPTTAPGVDEKSSFSILLTQGGTVAQDLAVDNVIITSDEP